MTKIRIYLILLALCAATGVYAQEDSLRATRYVMRSTLFGIGYNNTLETYLSPLEYTGAEIRFMHERMRMTRLMGGNVSTQSIIQGNLSYTENPAGNAHMYAGLVNWSYALHYRFRLSPQLKILAGPVLDLNGGVVYNLRNSNNPAQAKAYGSLGASAMAIYKFRIGTARSRYATRPTCLCWEPCSRPNTANRITRYSPCTTGGGTWCSPPCTTAPRSGRCLPSTSR